MSIHLMDGTYRKMSDNHLDCGVAGCHEDLNAHCPNELVMKANGHTVACKSACEAFNTDEYCCRGAHNTPQKCKSALWKVTDTFKKSCPDAYTYAYDDINSTFTCHSNGGRKTGYIIRFC